MVFVIGQPRTGTSWVMQLLIRLGVPVIGQKWRDGFDASSNVNGFWECPDWLNARGRIVEGAAAKINLRKAIERDVELNNHTVILCNRCRIDSAKSQVRMMGGNADRIANHDTIWYLRFVQWVRHPFTEIMFNFPENQKLSMLREAIQ